MAETDVLTIAQLFENQRKYFASQATKSLAFRLNALGKLKAYIHSHEQALKAALYKDLHKSEEEAYLTEISIVLQEIKYHIRHLRYWMEDEIVSTPLQLRPSRSKIINEPKGVVGIISPWNYPFQLAINPLIGAISAGCCAIVKPSPYAPEVVNFIKQMIAACFDKCHVALIEGEVIATTALLSHPFDQLFFTGSTTMGKVVMRAAAEHLTPVVLELGGKSPCIIDQSAHIPTAAKRVAWGKTLNAGQTCIAPDYVFVHRTVQAEFIREYQKAICSFYGENPKESKYFARIVSDVAMQRLTPYLKDGTVEIGGEFDFSERYISPTLLTAVSMDAPIMQAEIFGPILPVLLFDDLNAIIQQINGQPHPLAAYYFGERKSALLVEKQLIAGGICINDVLLHVANHHLPFGGIGNSGMGSYHGKRSFTVFTHQKAVLISKRKIDFPVKYAPYPLFKWIKKWI